MKNRIFLSVVFALSVVPVLAFGQLKQDTQINMAKALVRPRIQTIVGLLGLNPAKFSMSQSYSLSFATAGGHSFSQGLYLNTMRYQFSSPLSMFLQVGFQHQPFGQLGSDLKVDSQVFISAAGFEFKPSENLQLQFRFSQSPGVGYSPLYRGSRLNRFNSFDSHQDEANRQ